jgi:putative long chain acyl-CoA synthase
VVAVPLLPNTIIRPVGRLGAAAQNALEIARFGGLQTDQQPSPYELAAEHRVYRLRHYYPSPEPAGPPILLVPPLMLAAEIYDVAPATSAVKLLREGGADPWVVDFGAPERQAGGLARTLADHVLAVSDAVDRVRAATGSDVHLAGYSQGGMFCYQAAAYHRNDGLASLVTFGSPVDTRAGMPFGLPEQLAVGAADLLADLLRGGALPAWVSRNGFQLLDPVKALRNRAEFILRLHDRQALLPREGQRRFLDADGWVAWPGPALAEFVGQFVAHNRMLEGGFVIDDRLLTLADIACPILSVVGSVDEIAPAAGVRAIRRAAPRAEVYELTLPAGHFGLVVGSKANAVTWPTVAAWARWLEGEGRLPATVREVKGSVAPESPAPPVQNRLGYAVELTAAIGGGIARSSIGAARGTARGLRELAREAVSELPRLVRPEQMRSQTRISIGLLVSQRSRRAPDETLFLFEDRAYTAAQVEARIDNIVRGLISIGVRQGEHVGVLMGTRPSALALTVALSRLGAVAVLLRPDGALDREVELGQVRRIVADPERAAMAAGHGEVHTFVLGGGAAPREFDVAVAGDMEQVDPAAVPLPAWYQPNPGRAADLAFVVFTGEGAATRMSRITNRRWALSAFGTASSAALSEADTVYSVSPPYHPSGLMTSIGGAIAGEARLAMARSFNPQTFWDEVRRYGVTVASYTWTMLDEIVEAPPHPGERGHPVRLFIGSGMPRGLWRRVQRRFAPARVVEFYATTEAGAILVNVSGAKPGSMGSPLPGSARVRIAAYDLASGQLEPETDGFARECGVDEVGMLLARVHAGDQLSATPLRGVFSREDAWLETGDLFRRDADGDYWRVDSTAEVVRTASGPVFTGPIRDALYDLPAVELAVAYGIRPSEGSASEVSAELAVAAVTLRAGHELSARELAAALARLEAHRRPAVVQVVERIPVTTWHRPVTGPLRDAGLPEPSERARVWYLDGSGRVYRPLTEAARRRLLEPARGVGGAGGPAGGQAPSNAPSS